jgi:Fe2+ or Zn2+ uptake regulation protein
MRITPQRLAVEEALFSLRSHPTVEEVASLVHKPSQTLPPELFYHILETLVKRGW